MGDSPQVVYIAEYGDTARSQTGEHAGSKDPPLSIPTQGFDDSGWKQVVGPYYADELDSSINTQSGGGAGFPSGAATWYRKHFTMDPQYPNSKIGVVVDGAHTGAQVFDTLMPIDFPMLQTTANPSCLTATWARL